MAVWPLVPTSQSRQKGESACGASGSFATDAESMRCGVYGPGVRSTAASAVAVLGLADRGALERVRDRPHVGAGRGLEDVGGDALAARQAAVGAHGHGHLAERVGAAR